MSLEDMELHVVGYLSTVQESINRANAIIALAEKNPEHAETLSACAAILLAAALEQGVKTVLTEAGHTNAVEEQVDYSETEHAELLNKRTNSQWWRVRSLPSILTDRKFRLLVSHPHSQCLRELIDIRNKLVHIDEEAIHLVTPSSQVKVENNNVTVEFSIPMNPWGRVTLEKAKRFREAVAVYFREVLFPEAGQITHKTIVIRAF